MDPRRTDGARIDREGGEVEKPVVAITMGDANGIGPEIVAKVLAREAVHERCRPLIIGDVRVMQEIEAVVGRSREPKLSFRPIERVDEAAFCFPTIDALCPPGGRIQHVEWGKLDAAMGDAAARYLAAAYQLAMEGRVSGVVSAPLSKQALNLAGYPYPDELAYLADLTGSTDCYNMGIARSVWTAPVAGHVSFREIADRVKRDAILRAVLTMDATLRRSGMDESKIAVAALNVHAGEGGLFGREEIDEIQPAVRDAQAQGVHVEGPVPADIVFARAFEGEFHGVVCMYHDQANIARKLQPMSTGVTVFIGLPVPCVTTAHGTAFDKAGLGIADPGSLAAALDYTIRLSR